MDAANAPRPLSRVAAVALLGAVAVLASLWLRCDLGRCPDVEVVSSFQRAAVARVLDRDGALLAELRPPGGASLRFDQIPVHVRDAFVVVEDRRFYAHDGVDWLRVLGAARANVQRRSVVQGGSTITMQLARNLWADQLPATRRTAGRKLQEARVAFALEARLAKADILALYLSRIYFGAGAHGLDEASRRFFDKRPHELTLAEGALLAALPKAPTRYDPRAHPARAKERRDLVLSLLERHGRITPADAAAAREAPLGVVVGADDDGRAPWFVEQVRRELAEALPGTLYARPLTVRTTLDGRFQRAAERTLSQHLQGHGADLQAAIVALQPTTGDVLAWVGGRDFATSTFDRVKDARRQAGSAFKPFVYAAAIADGRALSERLSDVPSPVQLDAARTWQPQNFDGRTEGAVAMRDALVRSKNVPTVALGASVGAAKIERLANDLGIHDVDATPAMPLGTVSVSPLALATAYVPFAASGFTVAPRLILSVTDDAGAEVVKAAQIERRRVLEEGVAYLVTDVLRDALDKGTGRAARAAGFTPIAAGKTGTTSGATDAWFVGYTTDVVAAVWLGHDRPRPIADDATGGNLAAPLWGSFLGAAGATGGDWRRPAWVVARRVDAATGDVLRPGCAASAGETYEELFVAAAVPREVCPGAPRDDDALFARRPARPDDAPPEERRRAAEVHRADDDDDDAQRARAAELARIGAIEDDRERAIELVQFRRRIHGEGRRDD